MSARLASTPVSPRQAWSRLGLLGAVLAAAFALVAFGVAWLVPPGPTPWHIEFPLASLEVGVPREFRPSELGRDGVGLMTWIWLVRQPDGPVDAFWSRTTHPRDCSVVARPASSFAGLLPAGDDSIWLFRTPCIGSTFALDGRRVFGPARRGLDRFPTRVDGDAVIIDLTRIIRGQCGSQPARDCTLAGEPRVVPFSPSSWE